MNQLQILIALICFCGWSFDTGINPLHFESSGKKLLLPMHRPCRKRFSSIVIVRTIYWRIEWRIFVCAIYYHLVRVDAKLDDTHTSRTTMCALITIIVIRHTLIIITIIVTKLIEILHHALCCAPQVRRQKNKLKIKNRKRKLSPEIRIKFKLLVKEWRQPSFATTNKVCLTVLSDRPSDRCSV